MFVLLPGMDGTGALFAPLLETLPKQCAVRIIRYPPNLPLTYADLEQYVLSQLPPGEPITLLAESYSGPIALRLSANAALNLRAVIVVSSFASRPLGFWGAFLAQFPIALLLKMPIHPVFLRTFLLANDSSEELINATKRAISSVQPSVLAGRLRDALASRYCARLIVPATRVIAFFSTRDRLLGGRARTSIVNACPTVETYTIDAPHFALQTAPDQIVRKLRELGIVELQSHA